MSLLTTGSILHVRVGIGEIHRDCRERSRLLFCTRRNVENPPKKATWPNFPAPTAGISATPRQIRRSVVEKIRRVHSRPIRIFYAHHREEEHRRWPRHSFSASNGIDIFYFFFSLRALFPFLFAASSKNSPLTHYQTQFSRSLQHRWR